MKVKHYIAALIIAIASFAGGAWLTGHILAEQMLRSLQVSNAAEITINTEILKAIHANDINRAKTLLEHGVDGGLIGLSFLQDDIEQAEDISKEAIRKARDYRKKYPRQYGDEMIKENIEKTFRILDKET